MQGNDTTSRVPGVRIRLAHPGEEPALRAIEDAAAVRFEPFGLLGGVVADATPIAELEEAQQAGRLFVAEVAGRLVGFAFVEIAAVDGNAHLAELDVHPDLGRRGIGSALVRHVADWARAAGFPALTLTTFRDVPFNRPFYARLGFRVLGRGELGPELERIIAKEDALGLARAVRVAMRLALRGAPQHAPATARNREPILEVLRRVLPARGLVLEVAAGTGEHAAHFARALRGIEWQPTDTDPVLLASIAGHAEGAANVRSPRFLDVHAEPWPVERADAVVCINMVHIAPWAACEAMVAGAARVLATGAPLYLYGPYRIGGRHTAPSNEDFDASLRARDPAWGVRDLEAVVAAGERVGFTFAERVAMPANNQSVVLRRNAS